MRAAVVEAGALPRHAITWRVDWVLVVCTLALIGAGLVMVMSASGIMADRSFGDKYLFFRRQAVFALTGLIVMGLAAFAKREIYYRLTYPILFGVIGLLVVTLVTPLGFEAGGAKRWLRLGSFSMQPLEAAKVALVFYLAYFFSHKQDQVKTFSVGFLPPVMVTGSLCLLLLLQPDFGGAVFLCLLLFLVSLVGGTSLVYLGSSVILGLGCGWLLISQSAYRIKRWTAFLDPFGNAQDTGYQLVQSLFAFGSGGWFGAGLGAGKQKLLFLPEAHNDFILAVVGEELGYIGVSLIFTLLGLLLWRGFKVSLDQDNAQDRFIGYGMTLILAIGAVLNMAVVLGMAPPKGVPMPFLSYGGSSLIVSCFCIGVLLNLSRRRA
ncbi:putative lipid II flippase FtsW [Desulfovibrio ferrophilus]|uniref:Probable peptidoglycan glycosyltransferase FtsW n=1 Tax=Desulfovibrio ferrophilus TaxID=241368 RepID=A0A2Z6AZD5_9BACT|nr:putative lipid II flippase FtsW [Desulfovibrio ferrophilus]BBD08545.1 lipid II flippase FtsW [Desulfovibrio ferrophilus]